MKAMGFEHIERRLGLEIRQMPVSKFANLLCHFLPPNMEQVQTSSLSENFFLDPAPDPISLCFMVD